MKYRRKPVVIEAFQLDFGDHQHPHQKYPKWFSEAVVDCIAYYQGGDHPYYMIKTLEGDHKAQQGDWIIRGIKGELYPCKPDIFEAAYEAAS